jgi:hypothetical protein
MGFSVIVTDRDGWRKEYPLTKNIIHVGSAPNNEIVLDNAHGAGVAPRHVQVIATPQGARIVNIGNSAITIGATARNPAPPLAVIDIPSGEIIRIGDYTLTIRTEGSNGNSSAASLGSAASVTGAASLTGAASGGQVIGLRASFSKTQLWPDKPLEGNVLVRNLGDRSGAQFKLEIDGLDPDCYEIGPGPVLFPGAEKPVTLRLLHSRRPIPPAGEYRFQIRAIAPTAYPEASATITQVIYIMPYYRYRLHLEGSDS